jgi:hypothetical protein
MLQNCVAVVWERCNLLDSCAGSPSGVGEMLRLLLLNHISLLLFTGPISRAPPDEKLCNIHNVVRECRAPPRGCARSESKRPSHVTDYYDSERTVLACMHGYKPSAFTLHTPELHHYWPITRLPAILLSAYYKRTPIVASLAFAANALITPVFTKFRGFPCKFSGRMTHAQGQVTTTRHSRNFPIQGPSREWHDPVSQLSDHSEHRLSGGWRAAECLLPVPRYRNIYIPDEKR